MNTNSSLAFMQAVATFSLLSSLGLAYVINPINDSLFFLALDGFVGAIYGNDVLTTLNNSVVAGILLGSLLTGLNGKTIIEGSSPLSGKIGEQVLHKDLLPQVLLLLLGQFIKILMLYLPARYNPISSRITTPIESLSKTIWILLILSSFKLSFCFKKDDMGK